MQILPIKIPCDFEFFTARISDLLNCTKICKIHPLAIQKKIKIWGIVYIVSNLVQQSKLSIFYIQTNTNKKISTKGRQCYLYLNVQKMKAIHPSYINN